MHLRALVLAAVISGCGTPGPTFYKDVLPITQAQCVGCHQNGGIGPFALDTFEAAKPMAAAMAASVASKRMPPWLASADCGGPFVEPRVLTAEQISTIEAWAKAGAPAGNPSDAPPAATQSTGQQLSKVDASLKMPAPYTPSATLRDDYRCFIVDPNLQTGKTVTGYDIIPGNRRVVHHVILYAVKREDALKEDAKDATSGWECFGDARVDSVGALGAWAPGGSAVLFPRGTGIRLEAENVLAMQVHYNTDNAREADQTTVNLQYGQGGETAAYLLPIAADGFKIPPASTGFTYSEKFTNTLGFPVNVWGLLPHMHTRGKTISMKAGSTADECLVEIPRWDFQWQTQYFRTRPYVLENGKGVELKCSWDNPSSRTLTWGEGTSDEMCFAFIYATP